MMKFASLSALVLAWMSQLGLTAGSEPGHAARSNAAQCVDLLSSKIAYRNATLYEDRLASYYSANAALPPWCMVLPETTEDVSKIAEIIYEHQCPFGMRSGGHSAFTGASSVDDGITVDFGYMNTTTYDANTKLASIQPGSTWGKVYDTLDPLNLTVTGGRANVVGIGGFTTGGGYSFHSGLRGWACDDVRNFEVVLANGTVVNANIQENPDLFQALKGGSGNLGFVTRQDMQSNQIWGGLLTFNWSDKAAVFVAYHDRVENFAEDPASEVIISMVYAAGDLQLWTIITNSEANATASALNNYTKIPKLTDTTRIGSVAELVPEFTGATPLGVYANWFSGAISNKVVVEMLEFMHTLVVEYTAKMEATITHGSSLSVIASFQPVPRTFVDISIKNGGNVMGLEDVVTDNDALALWLFAVTVTEEADQPAVLSLAEEFVGLLNQKADELNANRNWQFLNYANGIQDPIAHYGPAAVAKMRAASAKYDPEGVFQNLRHSGFKIPV